MSSNYVRNEGDMHNFIRISIKKNLHFPKVGREGEPKGINKIYVYIECVAEVRVC